MQVHHHRGDSAYNLQERFVVKFRDTQQQTSQYNTNLEAKCKFFKLYMYFQKDTAF